MTRAMFRDQSIRDVVLIASTRRFSDLFVHLAGRSTRGTLGNFAKGSVIST